jgi:pyrroloquinoline quinone (PQQ) biosynthesis protein C
MPFFDRLQEHTAQARASLFAIPVIENCLAGRVTRTQYVAFLREAYHHVKHTVPLLAASQGRTAGERAAVRAALNHYIEEERGHEEWILQDLAVCGEDAEAVRHGGPGPATEIMVAYVYDYIQRVNPVGMLGMVHVLEGTSSALATRAAQAIQRALGLPHAAFTYLSSHGELDQEHVRFFERLVNDLSPEDQEAVLHVSGMVYRLYGDIFRGLPS